MAVVIRTVALNNASRFLPAESSNPTSTATPSTWYQPDSVDLAFRDRLLAINTPALADANKEGLRVMDHRLRPLNKTPIQFAGVARTVRCYGFRRVSFSRVREPRDAGLEVLY